MVSRFAFIFRRTFRKAFPSVAVRWVAGFAVVVVLGAGLGGAARYGYTFWRYRGFPPPRAPQAVVDQRTGRAVSVGRATGVRFAVKSAALGGATETVYVVLPPGYSHDGGRRYPVVYLLHGTPGQPQDFLNIGDAEVVEDVLVAQRRAEPAILVMPTGSTGFLADDEWANGVGPRSGWETYVARDVVGAVDHRYRTIATRRGRAIAGLSEGGYGALNIALHHSGEFGVIESWSGYMQADNIPAVFGHDPAVMAYNSPARTVRAVADRLRRDGTFIWFYCGQSDYFVAGNEQFNGRARPARREPPVHGGARLAHLGVVARHVPSGPDRSFGARRS